MLCRIESSLALRTVSARVAKEDEGRNRRNKGCMHDSHRRRLCLDVSLPRRVSSLRFDICCPDKVEFEH